MRKNKLQIAIIVTVIPNYREGFYDQLFASEEYDVTVYCMENFPGANLKTIHTKYPESVRVANCISTKNGSIVWQFIPYWEIYKNYSIIIIEGNPRVISQAFFASLLKLTRKKVVIWSMVHSFRNNKITENIRLRWISFFKYHFLYNNADVEFLKSRGFDKKVMIGMNNGLNQKKIDFEIKRWPKQRLLKWRKENDLMSKNIIISSGRLKSEKYDIVVEALSSIVKNIPDLLWCVIGDGPDRAKLEKLVKAIGLTKHVRFAGAIYEEKILASWFLSAKIFIHPNAIGLSIMHAFGYGLPVITHNMAATHGPEFVAFEENGTGRSFPKGDAEGFANEVIELLKDEKAVIRMGKEAQRKAREQYNVDVMVKRFNELIGLVINE